MRIEGKVAIVTGAARGIGEAIARRFAREGAKVVLSDLLASGEATAASIRAEGGDVLFVQADVSKTDQVKQLIQATVEQYGRIDVIVNNAAVNIPGSILDMDEAVWDKTMEVNLKSQFLVLKYGVPEMIKAGGGSIINMGSANSFVAEPMLSAYVASKGGILMFTKALALDFAPHNIRVNCICPGWVDTTINDAHAELFGGREKVLESIADFQPLGRTIRPDEIANVALFLASDESSAMTGSAVVPDGGITAK